MNPEFFREIDKFVTTTSESVNLRHDDSIIIKGTGRIQHLDSTGFEIVKSLYEEKTGAEKTVEKIHEKYGTQKNIIVKDLSEIVKSLTLLMSTENKNPGAARPECIKPEGIEYPSAAEIALTYRCQNRCDFCPSSDFLRMKEPVEMTTPQVKLLIDKLQSDVSISSVSFTGGEPSLKKDLPELIAYATVKGIKTILITNGIKCSEKDFVKILSESGLQAARVNLESHDELIHNRITGNIESYKKTVQGIHNLIDAGIKTHTNTTICRANMEHLVPLVKFVKDEFNALYLSMNMVITKMSHGHDDESICYSSISEILRPVTEFCNRSNIKLAWNTPAPYCMFNAADFNSGTRSCACVSDILSINPAGDVIPCSRYNRSIGSLLNDSFTRIWNSDNARYFIEKRYIPPLCKECDLKAVCKGGCPLYWENTGSFSELKKANKKRFFPDILSGIL